MWLSTPAKLQRPLPLWPQQPGRKNRAVSDHRTAEEETVQTYTCLHPVTVPLTPAEPYEPEFDWWAVSTDSAASSAFLSGHEDALTASLCLHKCDVSVQLHESEGTKPNSG